MAQRILVFESDDAFADQVKAGFGQLGAQVEVVADGHSGLERAAEERPDLILLSIELPSMNGFLVCKKIKKSAQLKDIPLVILSSDANAEEIFEQHKKLRTRAEEYIRKPVEFSALLELVQQLVPFGSNGELEASVEQAIESAAPEPVSVDEEIEAFAEDAFGALLVDEEVSLDSADAAAASGTHSTAEIEFDELVEIEDLGSGDEAVSRVEVREDASPPDTDEGPAVRVPSAAPAEPDLSSMPTPVPGAPEAEAPPGVDPIELQRAESRIAALESELDAARARATHAEKLEADLAQLKKKATEGAGMSSREFLDLREALNRKDKEILELKDQVTARDKQVLELRDSSLALERSKADFEDKLLDLERRLADAQEKLSAATSDRDAAQKRAEDYKDRLERTETRVRSLEEELESEREGHQTLVASMKGQYEKAASELQDRVSEEKARAYAEHAAQVERLKEDKAQALAAAEEAARAAQESFSAQLESIQTAAREEQAAAVARAEEEARAEMERRAAQAEDAKTEALTQLRVELETEMQSKLAGADARRETELQALREELEQTAAVKVAELEQKYETDLGQLRTDHGKELALLGRKLADSETQANEKAEQLAALGQERDQLRADLDQKAQALDVLDAEHRAAKAHITELTKTKEEGEARIRALETSEADLTARLDRAERKIEGDGALLERARKAMAIGLSLLEDQKNNSVDGS